MNHDIAKKKALHALLPWVIALAGCAGGSSVPDDDVLDEAQASDADELDVDVATMKLATPQCTTYAYEWSSDGQVVVPAASNGSTRCWLDRGSYGVAVRVLQRALYLCWGQDIAIDGDYGPQTAQAVWNVQAVFDIRKDGVYGPQTKRVMGTWFPSVVTRT
jgi:peptidoglycan hydrolase-like protein with peptidoglycan-binding domain